MTADDHNFSDDNVISKGVQHLSIDENSEGQRVDNFLRKTFPSLPKSKIYKILRKGEVRVNKKRVKPETKLKQGDILRVPPLHLSERATNEIPQQWIEKVKQTVLYQDAHYLILNKPAGIAVHGGSKQSFGLIDVVRQTFSAKQWELAHRLDKETSGCLVFASSRKALNAFQQANKDKTLFKSYLCLVKGDWRANQLSIESYLDKDADGQGFEKVRQVKEYNPGDASSLVASTETAGKLAVSYFTTEERYQKTTLMRVVIETGKTHQIRVHAASQGYPIAMDDKYGDFDWNKLLKKSGLNRLFLHSHIIRFQGVFEEIHVSAPLPEDLQRFLDQQ